MIRELELIHQSKLIAVAKYESKKIRLDYPFGGGLAMALGLLDAVLVRFVRLVVRGVILRLRHCSSSSSPSISTIEQ